MTGIAFGAAFLAGAAFGWRMALVLGLGAAAWLLARRQDRQTVLALAVVLAAALGAWRGVPPPRFDALEWVDQADGLRGSVLTAPTASGRRQGFELAVAQIAVDGRWRPAAGRVCVSSSPLPVVGLGDQVLLGGRPAALQDQPGAVRSYLRSRGCGATLFSSFVEVEAIGSGWRRGLADLRRSLSSALQRAAPGDAGALLSGLVTGDDHGLTPARRDAFLRTGTSHVTAVSGANLALVVAILVAIGSVGGWRRRLIWQLLTVGAVWGYAVLVGVEAPALRAALVATAAVFASRVGRRSDFVTLIVVAAAIMVAVEPGQLWQLSFQLSFAASLALAAVLPGLPTDTRLAALPMALAATVAAQVATLPVLLPVFGTLSLSSLPANLLIGPLIAIAFPLAALAGVAALIWFPLGEALALPAGLAAGGVLGIVDFFGSSTAIVASLGETSRATAILIAALAITVVLAMSRDGRTWATRLTKNWR